jgi:hypothetical protein
MKNAVFASLTLIAALWLLQHFDAETVGADSVATSAATDATLSRAFDQRLSNLQVRGEGVVIKLLADDTRGSRHQRFLLRLSSGQTLLIAHNIDLASRIEPLSEGDRIAFHGEYEWNDKGGVIHWTHHDPQRRHVDGWLEHRGRRYQ